MRGAAFEVFESFWYQETMPNLGVTMFQQQILSKSTRKVEILYRSLPAIGKKPAVQKTSCTRRGTTIFHDTKKFRIRTFLVFVSTCLSMAKSKLASLEDFLVKVKRGRSRKNKLKLAIVRFSFFCGLDEKLLE